MPRHNRKGRSKTPSGEQFVALRKHMRQCEAWRTLPHRYRSVYIEAVAGVYEANNGEVSRSVRFLAKAANCSADTAQKALRELQERGFMVRTEGGRLGAEGRGVAAKWRFTEIGTEANPTPTRDYARWKLAPENSEARTGEQHTLYRPAAHPVPPSGTPCTARQYSFGRSVPPAGTVCGGSLYRSPVQSYI
mgnify:CR=1 FL=1